MKYSEHRPHPALAPMVECFWLADDEEAAPARPAESVLPDGCLEWIFHVGAPYRRLGPDGTPQTQPVSFVVGQMTGPLVVQPGGPIRTMGVRFRPGGAYPFLRAPLDELTDAAVATRDLFGGPGAEIEAAVLEAEDDGQRRRILEAFLLRRLAAAPGPRQRLDAAVSLLLRRRGRAPVAAVARLVDWSPRQLEREFRRGVGVSPKSLARVLRFQNVLRLAGRDASRSWADLAAACGYADQAHLVREFRELSGRTPADHHTGHGELSRNFVTPDRLEELFRAPSPPADVAFLQDRPPAFP